MNQSSWSSLPEELKIKIVTLICQNYETTTSFENHIRRNDLLYPYCQENERYKLIPISNMDGLKIYIRELIDFSKITSTQGLINMLNDIPLTNVASKVKELLTNKTESNQNQSANATNGQLNIITWKELNENVKSEIINALSGDFDTVLLLEEYFRNNNILNNDKWDPLSWVKSYPETSEQRKSLIDTMLNFPNVLRVSDISFGLNYVRRPQIAELVCKLTDPNTSKKNKTEDIELYKIGMKNKLTACSVIATSNQFYQELGTILCKYGKINYGEWYSLSLREASTTEQSKDRALQLFNKVGNSRLTRDELIKIIREIGYHREADIIEDALQ